MTIESLFNEKIDKELTPTSSPLPLIHLFINNTAPSFERGIKLMFL